jgi:hypothetical protein
MGSIVGYFLMFLVVVMVMSSVLMVLFPPKVSEELFDSTPTQPIAVSNGFKQNRNHKFLNGQPLMQYILPHVEDVCIHCEYPKHLE